MPYWKLYYHLIWATYERQPLIGSECEAIIRTTLYAKAGEMHAVLHAIGNVADHVHMVASVPPAISLATCVKYLKGASSRAVNM
jgi:putative transposase